jgi:predicted nucleic acid-binding Zn ribbon protein
MTPTVPVCAHCGGPIQAARADARFCSTSCRVSAHRAANRQKKGETATLINEVIDGHDRATRLYATAKPTGHGLIHLAMTTTFSGALKPDAHRVAWQTTLPREAVQALREVLDDVLNQKEGEDDQNR